MTDTPRRIDHLVLAVDDLDAAARFYERIGFQVGARNRHPWGTENRIVQMRSSFLELITVGDGAAIPPHAPGVFSFGAFVRDYLRRTEGLAMLALDSDDAAVDVARFAAAGIGDFAPFSFERTGRRPDGSPARVGFSLAFATDTQMPDAGFFVCQQHNPDAFWNPLFQQHPNSALDVTGIVVSAITPADHTTFLTMFTGACSNADGVVLRHHAVLDVEQDAVSGFRGYRVTVEDLDWIDSAVKAAGVPARRTPRSLTLGAAHAFGTEITFVSGPSTASSVIGEG